MYQTLPFLVFALNKEMTAADIFKEFNQKVRTCTLPNKLIIQVMISIAMTYEVLCATARAKADAANIPYVSHTSVSVSHKTTMERTDVLPKQGIQFNQHAYLGGKKTFFL